MEELGEGDLSLLLYRHVDGEPLDHELRHGRRDSSTEDDRDVRIDSLAERGDFLDPLVLGDDPADANDVRFLALEVFEHVRIHPPRKDLGRIFDGLASLSVEVQHGQVVAVHGRN